LRSSRCGQELDVALDRLEVGVVHEHDELLDVLKDFGVKLGLGRPRTPVDEPSSRGAV
jgi:hypothetical protein